MTENQNNQELSARNIQIQKLIQAIVNYNPNSEELQAMAQAKKQMIKNIEKKFINSKVNMTYKFPFKSIPSTQSDSQSDEQMTDAYNLKDQNIKNKELPISKQKKRKPLQQKSVNKSQSNLSSKNQIRYSFNNQKEKQSSLVKNIQKVFKSSLKCQTPKVIKTQIVLTNKKCPPKAIQKIDVNNNQNFEHSQMKESINIKSKLKIKKPNIILNETKKNIHLRTQNNVNFKHYHELSFQKKELGISNQEQFYYHNKNLFNQTKNQQKFVIYEEPSQESLFFNSRTNLNTDENPNFQYPKPLFNVSDLKEKLKETSKSSKKDVTKRHKRTATQGYSQIKIKLFSSSFKKNSCEKGQAFQKLPFSTNLFKKSQNSVSSKNIMNRTVSSLSQNSLKKGIKICGRNQNISQKSLSKDQERGHKTLSKISKNNKTNNLFKNQIEQKEQQKEPYVPNNLFLGKQIHQKKIGPQLKVKRSESKGKFVENKNEKQNIQINRVSKINSIMTSIKQGYKNKNAVKPQAGIKTTVCR